MTVHAYIADLNRERREVTHRTGVSLTTSAVVAVCGAPEGTGSELRCFGLRRLATIWPLAGHNVTCPACRAEVRRLLGERTDPEREARIAALTRWAEVNPDGARTDTLKAEAQRRRVETQRRKERAARAAQQVAVRGDPTRCRYCPRELTFEGGIRCTTCCGGSCRAKLARDVRLGRVQR